MNIVLLLVDGVEPVVVLGSEERRPAHVTDTRH